MVQLFMGTSYSFKFSETLVYMCLFKTKDIKINTIFSLKVTIKLLSLEKKCYNMIIALT